MNQPSVIRYGDGKPFGLRRLLARYGLMLRECPQGQPIDGSFWGDEEAGLIGSEVFVREDTPLHSVLHEACHFVCMDQSRRTALDRDAGGGYDEENAVCYLQILLSGHIDDFGPQRMMQDMDRWGYSFRLGSARLWFEQDAEDAREWLMQHGIIDGKGMPTWRVREDCRT